MRARTVIVVALVGVAGYFGWKHRDQLSRVTDRAGDGIELPVVPRERPDPDEAIPRTPLSGPNGAEVELTLLHPPAAMYAGLDDDDDADETYRGLVEAMRAPNTRYDRDLSRAAREVAYQSALLGEAPPEAAMGFLLNASGAVETNALQFLMHTNVDDSRSIRRTIEGALARPLRGEGVVRIGVGEVETPGEKHTHHIAVLVTRRAYTIEPTPRSAPLRGTWALRGTLPPGYTDATASALYPDGRIASLELERDGDGFAIELPTGDVAGTVEVSIGGSDRNGPGKLLQLGVEVGHQPPRTMTIVVPPADPKLPTIEAAEAHALALLNADRVRFGLPALIGDPELAKIARHHSEEMRDRGYFAHRSPTTGLSSDRLAAARYRSTSSAENIALNDSLTEAEVSLLGSIGHRRNILSPALTHVGIGVARATTGEHSDWHLTQLFATPVEIIDIDKVAAELFVEVNLARVEAGVPAVRPDATLSSIAQRNAGTAADGRLEGLAQLVVADLREVDDRAAGVSVQAVYTLDQFDVPSTALLPDVTAVGLGVLQSDDDLHGRIGVVLIGARE